MSSVLARSSSAAISFATMDKMTSSSQVRMEREEVAQC